jgi:hypothetical protein
LTYSSVRGMLHGGMAKFLDHWGDIEDEALAGKALCAAAKKHQETNSSRKRRACELLSSYEGLGIHRFDAAAYDGAEDYDFVDVSTNGDKSEPSAQTHNLGARVMDAIDAKIFALERTKTQFVVSDGGWAVKAAAVKAGRFVEGQMSEPAGIFKDMWECWRHGARLATIATTASMMFFWSDPSQSKIVAELDDTLNIWVETGGLPYDGYSAIGRITYWEPRKLAARFPKFKDQIMQAAQDPKMVTRWRELYSQEEDEENDDELRVPFIQGWRMQYGDPDDGGVPGVQICAIPDLVLDRRAYDSPDPPCVRFCPMPQLAGKWGRTIFERCIAAVRRYNEILNSIDKAERLTPKGGLVYDPTSSDEEQLKKIEDVILIPHTGPMAQAPVYTAPPPFHPVVLDLLKLHKDAAFDLVGMNEAHATMALGKGLSGVAIRLLKQEVYEIFAPLEDEFTRCVGPETAKQIIRCARELQREGGFTAMWKGGGEKGWLQEIGADVFDVLEKQKYRVEPQSVSGSVNTPADNVELAKELVQIGIISGEAYAKILQDFNVFGATGNALSQAEERFIERQIDDWMYGDLETARRRYMAPEIWQDKDMAMTLKVGGAYLQARMDMIDDMDDPEVTARLGLFKTFMSQLTANAQQRDAMAAQAQAAAQGQQAMPAA